MHYDFANKTLLRIWGSHPVSSLSITPTERRVWQCTSFCTILYFSCHPFAITFRAFLKFRIKRELQRLNPINLIPSDSQDLNLLNLILKLTLPTVEDKSQRIC